MYLNIKPTAEIQETNVKKFSWRTHFTTEMMEPVLTVDIGEQWREWRGKRKQIPAGIVTKQVQSPKRDIPGQYDYGDEVIDDCYHTTRQNRRNETLQSFMNFPLVPPSNFAVVQQGLYRGSYPQSINFPFLKSYPLLPPLICRLNLKCMISMLPDGEAMSIKTFCEENGIRYIHIDTEEYDVDCIPSKEEKNKVVSVGIGSRICL